MTHDLFQAVFDYLPQIILIISSALLAALVVGALALRRARGASGEPKQTLWLIALHLLEAPANALIIGSVMYSRHPPYDLAITLPMAVLLLPALGLLFRDRDCRRVAGTLLGLGLLRWLVTAGIYASFDSPASEVAAVLLLGAGTLLLFGCVGWCAYLLNRLSVRSTVRRQVDQRVEWVCGDELKRA